MNGIHNDLMHLQSRKNPLDLIASKLTQEVKVLYFDEFFVDNIADAMLLGALLKALFVQKIYFIANSNIPPDDLYKKGLQRKKFLSAISLIKKHTEIFHLSSSQDY